MEKTCQIWLQRGFVVLAAAQALVQIGCGAHGTVDNSGFTEIRFGRSAQKTGLNAEMDLVKYAADPAALIEDIAGNSTIMSAPGSELVIYAVSTDQVNRVRHYFSSASAANSGTMRLPNATYKMYMVGFATSNMGGAPTCGEAVGDDSTIGHDITLSGPTKTITITGTPCGSNPSGATPFMGSGGNAFNSIGDVQICNNAVSSAGGGSNCTGFGGSVSSGTVTGMQFAYYDQFISTLFGASTVTVGSTPGIVSPCVTVSSGLANSGIPSFVAGDPTVSGSKPMAMDVILYNGGSCTTKLEVISFPLGISVAGAGPSGSGGRGTISFETMKINGSGGVEGHGAWAADGSHIAHLFLQP